MRNNLTYNNSKNTAEFMLLRAACTEDYQPLWKIFQRIIEDGATYVHDETTTYTDFVQHWAGRGGEQWVAELDEHVVGSATIRKLHPGRGSHVSIASFIVDEAVRGRGVGRRLVEHALIRARALGFSAMQFNCVVSTNEAALRLYTNLGFRIVGTLAGAFEHARLGRVDAHVMFRSLEG